MPAPRITARCTPARLPPQMREKFNHMQGDELPRGVTKRILIVEDNELNMKLLRDVLEAYGYATITTAQGATSLALARENRPDLILMDLQLPDISGFDAVRQLKDHEETRLIPVVAVTAFAMIGDERKALTCGCDAYLAKPILLRDFLNLVEKFIGGAAPAR
jgi:two-component system, cell cycle response regulator DivK